MSQSPMGTCSSGRYTKNESFLWKRLANKNGYSWWSLGDLWDTSYGIQYIDTSENRDEILNMIIEQIWKK